MTLRIVVYRSIGRRNQRWRWRAVASNGRIVATSGEGFANREHAIDVARDLFAGHHTVTIEP